MIMRPLHEHMRVDIPGLYVCLWRKGEERESLSDSLRCGEWLG